MQTVNIDLMRLAKKSLSGKWGLAIGTFLISYLILGAFQAPVMYHYPFLNSSIDFVYYPFWIIGIILAGPLYLGLTTFSLSLARDEDARIEQLFDGFKQNFSTSLGAYLLMILYVFLWSLLLIIPGIIAAFSYSMTFFILADDRTIGAQEALNRSKKMMSGYKGKLFCLYLRFFGWFLLCILSLGIGFLWLIPYIYVTTAKFYDDIK